MKIKDLKEGDMLFYAGSNVTSRVIRFFDQSYYAHASIYMGNNKVIESTLKGGGCEINPIDFSSKEYEKVLVRRHETENLDMSPVLARARKLKDTKYDKAQILQLAMIGISRRLTSFDSLTAKLLIKVLELANAGYMKLYKNQEKRTVCSELAYRVYQDAKLDTEEKNDIYNVELKFKSSMIAGNKSYGRVLPEMLTNGSLVSYFENEVLTRSNENFRMHFNCVSETDKNNHSGLSALGDLNLEDYEISTYADTYDYETPTMEAFSLTQDEEADLEELMEEIENRTKTGTKKISPELESSLEEKINEFMVLSSPEFSQLEFEKTGIGQNVISSLSSDRIDNLKRNFIYQRHHFVTAKDLRRASNFRDVGFYKNQPINNCFLNLRKFFCR